MEDRLDMDRIGLQVGNIIDGLIGVLPLVVYDFWGFASLTDFFLEVNAVCSQFDPVRTVIFIFAQHFPDNGF